MKNTLFLVILFFCINASADDLISLPVPCVSQEIQDTLYRQFLCDGRYTPPCPPVCPDDSHAF